MKLETIFESTLILGNYWLRYHLRGNKEGMRRKEKDRCDLTANSIFFLREGMHGFRTQRQVYGALENLL